MGKGGVGKSTTAGALALALARGGAKTHLLSTDPAPSLADLFGTPEGLRVPTPAPCEPRLLLEELDAPSFARRWMERARSPLLDLLERGTWLESEEVAPFLDLTLPGVDEVAGVLRLAELATDDAIERVVVDTAPTGHTLRLLDAGDVIQSWSEAFDAMAEKAAAVMGRLTRRPVRLAGDEIVQEMNGLLEVFRGLVLRDGSAVLVDREGVVVEAETRRLHRSLEERGLRVGLRVRVATGPAREARERADDPDFVRVPWRDDLEGCEALERWGLEEPGPPPPSATATGGRGIERLLADAPELLLFIGKGGVGKSTCAAAVALALSEERPVTLLGTDPAGSLGDVLAIELEGGVATPRPRLVVRQIDAPASFAELRTRYRAAVEEAFEALGLESGAVLDRRVMESLLGLAPPGLDEVFAVSAMLNDLEEGRTLVVDTAPTGHFLRLLAMPELALDWTRQLLRVLVRYRAALGLDAFLERLLLFAKQLKRLQLKLRDPDASGAFVIMQGGPLVAAETRRLLSRLHEAGVPVVALVANRVATGAPFPLAASAESGVAPRIRAPLHPEAPVGEAALSRFLSTWTIAP